MSKKAAAVLVSGLALAGCVAYPVSYTQGPACYGHYGELISCNYGGGAPSYYPYAAPVEPAVRGGVTPYFLPRRGFLSMRHDHAPYFGYGRFEERGRW